MYIVRKKSQLNVYILNKIISYMCNIILRETGIDSNEQHFTHVSDFASTLTHLYTNFYYYACCRECCAISLNEKFSCFNYKVFFFYSSRCTYDIKSYNVHMHHIENYTLLCSPLHPFEHAIRAAYEQVTFTLIYCDCLSDERSIAFLFNTLYVFPVKK